jgi:plastocyanin
MSRATQTVIAIIVIVAAAVGVGIAVSNKDNNKNTTPPPAASPQPSSSQTNTNKNQTAKAGEIQIEDMAFDPASVTVKKGATVKWTDKDGITHTVTSDTGSELQSPELGKGQSYSHTFTTAGTYKYHCSIHPNMTGTVIVTE